MKKLSAILLLISNGLFNQVQADTEFVYDNSGFLTQISTYDSNYQHQGFETPLANNQHLYWANQGWQRTQQASAEGLYSLKTNASNWAGVFSYQWLKTDNSQ